jgi:hypothetical protein
MIQSSLLLVMMNKQIAIAPTRKPAIKTSRRMEMIFVFYFTFLQIIFYAAGH